MIRSGDVDFSSVNRQTSDPDNVIDDEIKRQDELERKKMIKGRAQLRNSRIFDWVVNFILEGISLFDMISDIMVLLILIDQGFFFFASTSIFVMFSAILVCYGPLINFYIARDTIGSRLSSTR